ncbi:MAG: hypothetical protein IKD90_04795 [Clostridiales bacterium]|nr:hypothetical protein [Clostridiales bacterium]
MRFEITTSYGKGNIQAIAISKKLNDLQISEGENVVFDFQKYKEKNPFSNLLLINSIRRFRKRFPESEMRCSYVEDGGYLSHIGFFKKLGLNIGNEPGAAHANSRYVPITDIILENDFYGSIEDIAKRLTNTLQFDDDLQETSEYVLIETIRNVFEHAGVKEVSVAAQKWPTKNLVEIAIMDTGCGIVGSMGKKYSLNEVELLKYACKPGITTGSNFTYLDLDDPWRNSGYGLYMLKELTLEYNGSFIICSGDKAVRYRKKDKQIEEKVFSAGCEGTIICLRFSTEQQPSFSEVRKRILKSGEDEAKRIAGAIQKASRSSGGRYIIS